MNSILAINLRTLTVSQKIVIVIALILQVSAVIFVGFTGKITTIFLGLILAVVVFSTLFSVRRALFIFVAYISLLPLYPDPNIGKYLKISLSLPIAAALLLLILTFWLIDHLIEGKFSIKFTHFDKAFLAFLLIVGFSTLLGFARGYQNFPLLKEGFFFSLYLLYFTVVYGVDEEWIYRFFNVFVVITLLVSFGSLLIAMPFYKTASSLFRITTQQPRLALVSIPYLFATILNTPSRRTKLIASFPILCLTAMVIISLTRALWLGLIASLLTLFFLHAFSRGISRRTLIKFVILVVLIPGLIFLSFTIIYKIVGGSSGFSILFRLLTLKNPFLDTAVKARIIDYSTVIEKMGGNILWGRGLGDVTSNIAIRRQHNIVDNSFITLYWKMGILGLASYLIILFFLFQRCFYVLGNSPENKRRRVIALSTISCFTGLIVTTMADTLLTSYVYIGIWAILMGSIELIARNISAERKKSLSVMSL